MANGPERARIEKATDGASSWSSTTRSIAPGGASASRSTAPASPSSTAIARKGLYFVRYANPDLDARRRARRAGSIRSTSCSSGRATHPDKPEQYRVVVTQADPRSVVTVQDPSGVRRTSTANGEKILALLKDQLK